jgi:hypothetical protein
LPGKLIKLIGRILLAACCAAFLACASASIVLAISPRFVEVQVRSAIVGHLRSELEAKFGDKLAHVETAALVGREIRGRITALHDEIESPEHDVVAAIIAKLCHYECGNAPSIATRLRDQIRERIPILEGGLKRVETWAASRYSGLVQELIAELRIFTGANAALFLLGSLGLWKFPQRSRLRVVTMLLLASTLFAGYVYVHDQNWLLTFVLSSYVGWGYVAWVALVFLYLVNAMLTATPLLRPD